MRVNIVAPLIHHLDIIATPIVRTASSRLQRCGALLLLMWSPESKLEVHMARWELALGGFWPVALEVAIGVRSSAC